MVARGGAAGWQGLGNRVVGSRAASPVASFPEPQALCIKFSASSKTQMQGSHFTCHLGFGSYNTIILDTYCLLEQLKFVLKVSTVNSSLFLCCIAFDLLPLPCKLFLFWGQPSGSVESVK